MKPWPPNVGWTMRRSPTGKVHVFFDLGFGGSLFALFVGIACLLLDNPRRK